MALTLTGRLMHIAPTRSGSGYMVQIYDEGSRSLYDLYGKADVCDEVVTASLNDMVSVRLSARVVTSIEEWNGKQERRTAHKLMIAGSE